MKALGGLRRMTVLNLSRTKLTDAGVAELREMAGLQTLTLQRTKRLSHKPGFSLKITGKDVVFGAKQDLWDSL